MGSRRPVVQTWIEVCGVVKDYAVNDPLLELRNIMDYYSSTMYQNMLSASFM